MKKLPAFVILAIISLVAALALALTNALTAGPIEERAQAALRAARQVVLPADTFEEAASNDEAVAVHSGLANGEVIGYTGVVTVNGYAGPVEVILGVDTKGTITGISVGGANFSETAGLGAKAKEPGFTDQFKEKTLPVALKANIDAIGGATITSQAVVDGVNKAGTAIAATAGFELGEAPAAAPEAPVEIGAVTPGTMTGESQGFQSAVKATVTVGEDGLISEVVIASADETQGFGTRLDGDADFASQFVGKMGPFAIGEGIDALAGATVTSEAAVKAVNQALMNGPEAPKPAAGTATGEAQGFQSIVKATVTVGEDGLISEVVIESAGETEGFGTKLNGDADFAAQFVGLAAPVKLGAGVEAVSGATVTSKAAIEAVNNAVSSLAASGETLTVISETEAGTVAVNEKGQLVISFPEGFSGQVNATFTLDEKGNVTDAVLTPVVTSNATVEGNTATSSAQGFESKVKATVTVDDNGVITEVKLNTQNETEYFGMAVGESDWAQKFVGKTGPFEIGKDGIDAYSRATFTSKAAVEAINDCLLGLELSKGAVPASAPAEEKEEAPASTATVEGNTATASAQGFESQVKATVTVDDNGVITEVKLNTQNETEYFGMAVGESDWAQKFVGKTGPFEIGKDGIDAYSRATFTSKAAVAAINDCLIGLGAATPAEEEAPASTATVEGNTATASAQGFESQVKATVTVDDNGVITEVKLNTQNETEYFGMGVGESTWPQKFVGKTGPFEIGKDGIDAYSGATFTSKAAVAAINDCLIGLGAAAPAEEEAPASTATVEGNTATASAQGFESQVKATVTVDDKGVISEVKLFTQNETEYFGMGVGESDWPQKFVGKTGPFEIGKDGIDAYSGATFTSKAAVEAINAALAQ